MALPMVLWIMVLGAGLVAFVQFSSRDVVGRTGYVLREQALRQDVDAAFARATYDLLRREPQDRPYREPLILEGEKVSVTVEDACGRLDINWVDRRLMETYSLVQGLGAVEARRLADRIEAARTRQAMPFATVDALRPWVTGLSDGAWLDFAAGLTTACPASGVDPDLAPGLVRRALNRLGPSDTRRLTQASARQFYDLTAVGKDGNVRYAARQWVALPELPEKPFVILGRQRLFERNLSR